MRKEHVDPETVLSKLKKAGVGLSSWASVDEARRSGVLTPEELAWFAGVGAVKPAVWKKEDAARYLDISVVKLLRLVRAGEVPHVRVGRSLRFTKDALDAYIRERTTTAWAPRGHEDEGDEG